MSENIRLLYWFNFFSDFRLYAGIAILYFAKITGSYALATSIFSITFIASALAEIPTGIYSDKIGRRNTIIIGSVIGTLAVLIYAISGTYLILVLGAILDGISRSFFSGNNEALLYDSLAEDDKQIKFHEHSGKVNSAFQVALAIASGLGGFIALLSFPMVFFLSLIPQFIALVISFKFKEPVHVHKETTNIYGHLSDALKLIKANLKLRYLSIYSILSFGLGEAGFQFRAAFVNTLWPVWAVGLSTTFSFIGGAIGFHFSGKIIDKLGEIKILIYQQIFSKFINFIALGFPTVASPALMTTTSITYGPNSVAQGTLMQKEFSDKQRATLGSLNLLGGSVAFGIISFLLGTFADSIGPAKALLVLWFAGIIPLYFLWKIFKQKK